jgi:exodeoxyribonuclease V beta subunit
LEAADRERHREELRLLYVALTRAQHALWVGVAAYGKDPSCDFHRSALGYLLGGRALVAGNEIAPLLQKARGDLPSIALVAGTVPAHTRLQSPARASALGDALVYSARFEVDWSIGSFSRLVRDLSKSPITQVPADPALQEELLVAPVEAPVPPGARPPRHRFPRGALPGNFLHDQLEWLAGASFGLARDAELRERLRRRCERQGWGHRADDIVEWLSEVVTTPLPALGVSLDALSGVLPEMEFWFPSDGLAAGRIDVLCNEHLLGGRPRPPLGQRTLNGMVMGFADLVFEHGGRYWVLDYKSNALGLDDADYDREALESAMAEHRYDVQAALYLLALHRLLRTRLAANYRPERHLGGAIYLFLRGVKGPERGCYGVTPPPALLDALDAALGTVAEAAP